MIIEPRPQVLPYLVPVPVPLPRECLPVPQVLDQDHVARELATLDGSTGIRGENRAQEHRTLRIDGLAIRPAKLIPNIEVSSGHLMAVVGLRGEKVTVVH